MQKTPQEFTANPPERPLKASTLQKCPHAADDPHSCSRPTSNPAGKRLEHTANGVRTTAVCSYNLGKSSKCRWALREAAAPLSSYISGFSKAVAVL